MTAFITVDELRETGGNAKAADLGILTAACAVGMSTLQDGWNGHPGVGIVVAETVTAERVRGNSRTLILHNKIRSVTTITDERTGATVDPATLAIDGQFLHTKDGTRVPYEWLYVTYQAGIAADVATVPEWAKSAALGIALQVFRQRFKLGTQVDGPVGFLVPALVEAQVQPHLLVSMGFA